MSSQEYFEAQKQNMEPHYHAPQQNNAMGTAAMMLGILAVAFAFACPMTLTFVAAPLSILLALLSKGYDTKMCPSAKVGFFSSVCGVGTNVLLIAGMLFLFFSDPQYRQTVYDTYSQTFEAVYGTDFNDAMKELYGDDFNAEELFHLPPADADDLPSQDSGALSPGDSDSLPAEDADSLSQRISSADSDVQQYVGATPDDITNFGHKFYPLD